MSEVRTASASPIFCLEKLTRLGHRTIQHFGKSVISRLRTCTVLEEKKKNIWDFLSKTSNSNNKKKKHAQAGQ